MRLAKQTTNLFRARAASSAPGLDVGGLSGVIEIDPHPDPTAGRPPIAEVQGMCTYEDLVDATLPHGLIPLVVPQLRTITLGGAVTGLGIESTSFRSGLPHESVPSPVTAPPRVIVRSCGTTSGIRPCGSVASTRSS